MSLPFLNALYEQLQAAKNNTACVIEDQHYSYDEFAEMAGSIQGRVQRTGSMHIGIITQNAPQTYATIIACWLTGKAYVPIPAHYPIERIKEILGRQKSTPCFMLLKMRK